MPTHQDETVLQRYAREHQGYLAQCGALSPEQVADLQMQLHNALAREAALQARLTVADQLVDDLQAELTKARELLREGLEEFKDGDDWIDRVVAVLGTKPAPATNFIACNVDESYGESAPACNHEWDINEQGTATICSVCGIRSSEEHEPSAKDPRGKIYETRTSKSAKAPEGLRPDQIVEVYGGGFQQIGSVARTDWRNVEKWRIADTAPAEKDGNDE